MSLKETACVLNIPSTEQTVIVYQCLIPTAILFQLHVLAVNFELASYKLCLHESTFRSGF